MSTKEHTSVQATHEDGETKPKQRKTRPSKPLKPACPQRIYEVDGARPDIFLLSEPTRPVRTGSRPRKIQRHLDLRAAPLSVEPDRGHQNGEEQPYAREIHLNGLPSEGPRALHASEAAAASLKPRVEEAYACLELRRMRVACVRGGRLHGSEFSRATVMTMALRKVAHETLRRLNLPWSKFATPDCVLRFLESVFGDSVYEACTLASGSQATQEACRSGVASFTATVLANEALHFLSEAYGPNFELAPSQRPRNATMSTANLSWVADKVKSD